MSAHNFKNLTGKKFGRLIILERAKNGKRWRSRWKCQCSCGNIVTVGSDELRCGSTKSCGCLKKELAQKRLFINLIGQIFGRLTVIRRAKNSKKGRTRWECLCECGNIVTVVAYNLQSGGTKSCGCLGTENLLAALTTHGMTKTPEYWAWEHMIQRCYNPNNKRYKDWGGRGIEVCDEWRNSLEAFYEHIGPKPTDEHMLERIDNNKGYFPGNIKWALPIEQNNNKRNNHPVTINGLTLNISQWARKIGINHTTIHQRIHAYGWPPEKAILEPVKHR